MHRQWADKIDKDRDILLVKVAIKEDAILDHHPLLNKKYHDAWNKGQLEYDEGLLFHTGEPKITCVCQLQRRVVPKSLRQIVITAYHACHPACRTFRGIQDLLAHCLKVLVA